MKFQKFGDSYGVRMNIKDMNAGGFFDKQWLQVTVQRKTVVGYVDYHFTSKMLWVNRNDYFLIFPKYVREFLKLMVGDNIQFVISEVR